MLKAYAGSSGKKGKKNEKGVQRQSSNGLAERARTGARNFVNRLRGR